MFPSNPLEINGPTYILLPTEPLTCLAWDATRQKVYAAPVDIPQAPEGANDLSESEILLTIEPTDVNHVWVMSRLSGSEDVVSLRTSTGTFLTASPSGSLTATTPSRGPLEAFIPITSSSFTSSSFPSFALQIQHNSKYFSATTIAGKAELRADADGIGESEGLRIKCQREFVYKARQGEDVKGKKRMADSGPTAASIEDDELRRNREAQTWGAGRVKLSDKDRRDVKKAKKEGRYAEAMLDRRAALKSDRYAK